MKSDEIEQVLTSAMADRSLPTVAAKLADELGADAPLLVTAAHQAARAIARAADDARSELSAALARGGLIARNASSPDGGQSVAFGIEVPASDLDRAIAIAESLGYRPWYELSSGAMAAYLRSHSSLTMVRVDQHSTRLFLRWSSERSRWRSRLAPTPADLATVDLPWALSPLYYGIRVVRKALGRGDGSQLGPFLGTPHELLEPLFQFAELSEDDLVLDVGCGDGRVLIDAAVRYGCRGIGLENDQRLAILAQDHVDEAGVGHLVEIRGSEFSTDTVPPATLTFLFLPPPGLRAALPRLIDEMPSGGRVLAHEQLALNPPISPDRVTPIIGEVSMTTASLWLVS